MEEGEREKNEEAAAEAEVGKFSFACLLVSFLYQAVEI